ncbi:hypothetical protein HK100_011913 [Physocladia obscura]|uniref:Uncharacterized protein n=1 Tax=Physocladia obscura TaxID=109957 RepID=A0AAD5XGM1_9FUNG|nr:hypothetical protein HK100_011913 [Physocladia obscura]
MANDAEMPMDEIPLAPTRGAVAMQRQGGIRVPSHFPPKGLALVMRYAIRDARHIEAPRLSDSILERNGSSSGASKNGSNVDNGTDDTKANYIEIMCVCHSWLNAAATLLYRTLSLRSTPLMLTRVTHTLLDPHASLPYAMLVKHITNYNSPEFDNSLLEMGDIDTLLQVCPMLTSFVFTASPLASNILVQSIADNCRRLSHLSLRECPVTDALISTLCSSCPRIAFLDLSFSLVSVASIPAIVDKLPALSTLWLESILPSTTPVSFSVNSKGSKSFLKSVNLKNSAISDIHLRYIAQACPNLKTLLLDGCIFLTDDGIVSLSRSCVNLEILDLSFISSVTDLSIYSIALCLRSSIQILSLCGCSAISVSVVQFLIDECCSSSQTSRKSLNQLVLHGCTQIINSYIADFDTAKTPGGIECMLESESLKLAVSVSEEAKPLRRATEFQPVSPSTMAKLTGELEDYAIDRGELWMRAAFNTSAKMFGGFESEEPATPKSASRRSSSISIKRSSSNSSESSDASLNNSRLPTPKSSNIRLGATGIPTTPSKLVTPSKLSRPPSTPTPSGNLRKPTKINFSAYGDATPSTKILSPLAKSSRVSNITQSSYSRNSGLGFSTPTKGPSINSTAVPTSVSQTNYKPRTFKKFNDSTDDIIRKKLSLSAPSTPSAVKSGVTPANRTITSPVRSKTSGANNTQTTPTPKTARQATSLSAPRVTAKQSPTPPLSSSSSVTSTSSVESAPKSLSTGNGLDRWRKPNLTRGSENDSSDDGGSSPRSSGGGLDKWRKTLGPPEMARTTSGSSGLDKWRKPVVEPTNSLSSGSGLDKWRKSVGATESVGGNLEKYRKTMSADVSTIAGAGGLEKYRKTGAAASPGSSKIKSTTYVKK